MADWFRWWHGTVTDPKFLWVSRKSGQRLGDVGMTWAALLEHASQADDRGSTAGFDAESMDCLLGLDDGSVRRIIEAMVAKGMICDDGRLTGWDRRQPRREDSGNDDSGALSSTERSRLYRANKRIEELERLLEQRDATQCNAAQRDATQATARVEESRQEESKQTLSPSNVVVDSTGDAREAAGERNATSSDPSSEHGSRAGALCKRLRALGFDAAPHMPALADLLPRFTDEQILAVAEIAKAKKPNERLHLHYLVPMLNAPPQPPPPRGKKTSRHGDLSNIDYRDGISADGSF